MNARSLALAAENESIDASARRAAAAKKPPSALECMASKLQISPGNLMNTLRNTVFKECRSDEEFAALVVVSNEYGLNPLLKEIYAFPAKGGGVVPMVSVDGWIRIMNSHPQFDGIEFTYHNDANGKTEAIESVIFCKDRAHPVKVIEYMDECKGNTAPWQKSPRRMLRHRALIQGARIAFGFSGIVAEGDEPEVINVTGNVIQPNQRLPSAAELDDQHDLETGEVLNERTGMTELSEDDARALDAQSYAEMEGGRADHEHGDQHDGSENAPAYAVWLETQHERIEAAQKPADLRSVETEVNANRDGLPDDVQEALDGAIKARRAALLKS